MLISDDSCTASMASSSISIYFELRISWRGIIVETLNVGCFGSDVVVIGGFSVSKVLLFRVQKTSLNRPKTCRFGGGNRSVKAYKV
jgi:hypothetical protein